MFPELPSCCAGPLSLPLVLVIKWLWEREEIGLDRLRSPGWPWPKWRLPWRTVPGGWCIKERASPGSDPSPMTFKMNLGRASGQGPTERSSLTNTQKNELDVSLPGLISLSPASTLEWHHLRTPSLIPIRFSIYCLTFDLLSSIYTAPKHLISWIRRFCQSFT